VKGSVLAYRAGLGLWDYRVLLAVCRGV